MRWMNDLECLIARLGRSLCAGLFLRVGPCHLDFDIDRRGGKDANAG
jgi:hypothetical protein